MRSLSYKSLIWNSSWYKKNSSQPVSPWASEHIHIKTTQAENKGKPPYEFNWGSFFHWRHQQKG
jgi:hypothetical protein